ncbi:unnamed protein product [Microthlaspi erraticum]|uniref:Uncharacterized protein n=1 Tax=Microthlaspi erraticum TaxID=1685480 RepID=A0A6D2IAA6_9BRAS|nr:unnamed protein product [Microthlaspi erraticum]
MLEKEDDDCEEGDEGGIPESEGVRERETGQETEGGDGKEMKGVQVSVGEKEILERAESEKEGVEGGCSMVEREEEKIISYDKTGEEDSEGGIGDGNAKEVHEEEKREAEGEETAWCEAVHQVSAEEAVAGSDVGAVGEYTDTEKLLRKLRRT